MTSVIKSVDWEKVHSTSFVFEDKCWSNCGSLMCCDNSRYPDFDFKFLAMKGTTILFMEDEYRYLQSCGRVSGEKPKTIEFDFGEEKPLRFVHTPCNYFGMCREIERPLLCKTSPFIPVMSLDGNLEDLIPSTIYELTFEILQQKTWCPIWLEKEKYFNLWQENGEILDVLKHPYLIFHTQVLKIYAEIYSINLLDDHELLALKGKEFWRRWEMEYLFGNLVSTKEITEPVQEIYSNMRDQYGTFL